MPAGMAVARFSPNSAQFSRRVGGSHFQRRMFDASQLAEGVNLISNILWEDRGLPRVLSQQW
jgi:hypothetical protein